MPSNYPTTYDDNTSMPPRADGDLIAALDNNNQLEAIKALEQRVGKTGTEAAIYANLPPYNAVGDGGTDNSAALQAAVAAIGSYGNEIALLPGRYRFLSEVDVTDLPSVKFRALGGKHYQARGTTAAPVQSGGVILEGWTPGMTLLKCEKVSNESATHQGPTFDGIGFQDGRAVNSRRGITAVAAVSGTTYRYTTSSPHGFTTSAPNNTVLINGVSAAAEPFGTAFNGHKTITNVSDTTHFDVNIGSNPSTVGLTFTNASVFYAPSMTLLHIKAQTRARLRDCAFTLGLIGLRFGDGTNDVSWSNIYGCGFQLNDTGVYGVGEGAQSVSYNGGDFQIGNGQIGIDYAGSAAMFKARDFKMDTLYNDGTGCIGIRLQKGTNYVIDGSFEMDGPAVAVQTGTTAATYGRISSSFQANNTGTKGSRLGTAVSINGTTAGTTDTNTDAGEVSLMGSTFNGFGKCVDLSNTRGAKIIGGSQALCDIGVNVASTCQGTIVAFFTRRRKESGSDTTAAGHITDAGVGTKRIFCDNVNEDGGIVPGAGSTTMTEGFISIPSGAGPPTGVPALYSGTVPLYFDRTGKKLYIYSGGWLTQAAVFA